MQNWFESWFDSKYYHMLYKNRDEAEANFFMDNLLNYLKLSKESCILDLACGKGRHALFLAAKGYKVHGVDLSEQSILHAKKFSNKNLSFAVHDMRNPHDDKFDAVFNLFTSFGYFKTEDEHIKTLKNMESALKNKDSVLVIDFFNAVKTIHKLKLVESKKVDGVEFNIRRQVLNNAIIKDIAFKDNNKYYNFQESVMAFTLGKLEKMLMAADLKITQTFGDYALNSFQVMKSDRLIILAQKQ